mgnify:CR=1 FL=1
MSFLPCTFSRVEGTVRDLSSTSSQTAEDVQATIVEDEEEKVGEDGEVTIVDDEE